MLERRFSAPGPLDLGLTFAALRRALPRPSMDIDGTSVWRATRTPEGPTTIHLRIDSGDVVARAWGPGAERALDEAPAAVGAYDKPEEFHPTHPVVRDLQRRLRGLRLARAAPLVEVLVPTVLGQRVITNQARASYARLVRLTSERAPGPAELFLPPDPAVLAATSLATFHECNVERRRADVVKLVCTNAGRLNALPLDMPDVAERKLRSLPGIGQWTAGELRLAALGDMDAVIIGDYHLANHVAWALAGEPRATDDRMVELLEPFRGHRGRVIRMIRTSGTRAPRYGARMPYQYVDAL